MEGRTEYSEIIVHSVAVPTTLLDSVSFVTCPPQKFVVVLPGSWVVCEKKDLKFVPNSKKVLHDYLWTALANLAMVSKHRRCSIDGPLQM